MAEANLRSPLFEPCRAPIRDRRRAGDEGGGIMAASKPFSPSFSKFSTGFRQGFRKDRFGRFGKAPKPNRDYFQTFSPRRPPFGCSTTPHRAAFRRLAPRGAARFQPMVESVYAGRWRRAGSWWSTDTDHEKFQPSMSSDYAKRGCQATRAAVNAGKRRSRHAKAHNHLWLPLRGLARLVGGRACTRAMTASGSRATTSNPSKPTLPRAYANPEPSKPWPQNAAYMDPAADTPAYRPDSIARSSRNRISPSLPASEITKRTRPWLEVSA